MKRHLLLALAVIMTAALWGCGSSSSRSTTDDGDNNEPTPQPSQLSYVGSAACQSCHSEIYSYFIESGHPFKLSKVVDGQVPTFPHTDITGALERITDSGEEFRTDLLAGGEAVEDVEGNGAETDNALGTPLSYDDVSYVIGGFAWKSRWLDTDGFIVTGDGVQFNLEDDTMSAYHNNEVNKVYNCGNCHTTGWQHYDATLNPNRQDDLPGMDGTFVETGIGCEACHGAGSAHVENPSADNIVINAQGRTTSELAADDMGFGLAVTCGECHTRDGEKDYPTYLSPAQRAGYEGEIGGRIVSNGTVAKHHEQYDELLGLDINADGSLGDGGPLGKHLLNGVTCTSCHNPHKTVKHGEDGAIKVDCLDCHGDKDSFTIGFHGFADCTTCHMPKLVKNAIWTGENEAGKQVGDIKSHIFKIDLDKTEQLTDSNSYVYPWITPDYACGECHSDPAAYVQDLKNNFGGKIH